MAAKELINTILKNSANLKAYYRFESGALTTDSSGNGITLTDVGGTTAGTGVFGNGADFSPGSKCLYKTGDIGMGTGAITIVGWFKFNSHTASQTFANFATSTYFTRFDWYQPSGVVRFYRVGTAQVGPSYTWTPTDGVWYHIAMVFNGTNTTGYINGAVVATGAGAVTNSTYTAGIGINSDGQNVSGAGGSMSADDVAFYNTALSADQIKELYEGRTLGEGWPQTGLVGLWHLNGNSTDFSGNNNHGTDTAITYSLANGKFNQGAGFNGSSSKVVLTTSASLKPTTAFTIATWLKTSSTAYGVVFQSRSKNTAFAGFSLEYSNNQCFFYTGNNTGTVQGTNFQGTGSASFTNNKWHFVVGIWDGANLLIYIDGALSGSAAWTTAPNYAATSYQRIGCGNDSGTDNNFFTGNIDEVVLYGVAKDANWVRKQYHEGLKKFYVPTE